MKLGGFDPSQMFKKPVASPQFSGVQQAPKLQAPAAQPAANTLLNPAVGGSHSKVGNRLNCQA